MWVAVSITACGVFPASADLPGLDDRLWVGHFLGLETKAFHFGVTTQGRGLLAPVGKKGDPVSPRLGVGVDFVVLETMPDGKVVTKVLKQDSLESGNPASSKWSSATIRGKVTGDAAFEVTLNNERGKISLGGKLLDPGQLKNPLKFGIRVSFPNTDPFKKEQEEGKKKDSDKDKGDRLQLKRTDGKNVKLTLSELTDASSPEVSGPGITALNYEITSHQGKKVECIATEGSFFTLSSTAGKPLNEGFTALWLVDPAKDPAGRARLSLEVE
jgi:hypothetical protein